MFKLLTSIGIVVMFIVGIIIGIQFMVASAEDKAKVKEALVPYIVGCIVIFGAFTIWSVVVKMGQSMTTGGSSGSSGSSGTSGNSGNSSSTVQVKTCTYCGAVLTSDTKCFRCGNSVPQVEEKKCKYCGAVLTSDTKCFRCGSSVD